MKPALTAEEWAELGPTPWIASNWGEHIAAFAEGEDRAHGLDIDDDRHAIAAIALYGQPFGFTHQHLKDIDWVLEQAGATGDYLRQVDEVLKPIRKLIASLLPPE